MKHLLHWRSFEPSAYIHSHMLRHWCHIRDLLHPGIPRCVGTRRQWSHQVCFCKLNDEHNEQLGKDLKFITNNELLIARMNSFKKTW